MFNTKKSEAAAKQLPAALTRSVKATARRAAKNRKTDGTDNPESQD